MKRATLLVRVIIGILSTISIFAISELRNYKCPECDDSHLESRIASLQERLEVLEKANGLFIGHLFSIEDREAYISHLDSCYQKANATAKDSCVMSFIFETENYEACFFIDEFSLKKSCLNMVNHEN